MGIAAKTGIIACIMLQDMPGWLGVGLIIMGLVHIIWAIRHPKEDVITSMSPVFLAAGLIILGTILLTS